MAHKNFTDDAAVKFERPVDDPAVEWWIRCLSAFTPRTLAEFLSAGLPGQHRYTYRPIDAGSGIVRVEMRGDETTDGFTWISEQHIRPGGAYFVGYVQVVEHRQGQGIGKKILGNAGRLALEVGTGTLELLATDVGAYAWGRYGFLPDEGSWMSDVVPPARRKLQEMRHANHVDAATADRVRKLLDDADPRTLRALIGLRKKVPGNNPHGVTTLGRALLIDSVSSWRGSIDLKDASSRAMFERYTGERL